MSPFQAALSQKLAASYIAYFNDRGLKDPATGEALTLSEDGRGGPAYDYLLARLEDSASDFLDRLDRGELLERYSVQDYLSGQYIR